MKLHHPLGDLPVTVGLAAELQQAHVLAAPRGVFVSLHHRRGRLHAGPWHDQWDHGAAVSALGKQVQPHLRFGGLVVEEDATRDREGRSLVVQPLSREAVRELGRVRGHVPEEEALAVTMEDVLMVVISSVSGKKARCPCALSSAEW